MFVRLTGVRLSNFKNVEFGEMLFPNYQSVKTKGDITKSDITGIYGQNGSGKTAVVEALDVAKNVLSGNSVSYGEYSGIINDGASILLSFFISTKTKNYKVDYEAKIQKFNEVIGIPFERLSFWTRGAGWKNEQTITIENPYYEEASITNNVHFTPTYKGNCFVRYDFISNPDKLAVYCASHGQSFLFNGNVEKILANNNSTDDLKLIIQALQIYAKRNLFVIRINQLAETNRQNFIPLNIYFTDNNCVLCGCLPLFTNGIGSIPKNLYENFNKILKSINTALCAIVPNLRLEPKVIGEEKNPDGVEIVKFEMYSIRDGKEFSTKYESEGIKRIISLLSCLISAFNDPGITLVVDELDSGIFEFLLGEILCVIEKEAKGQIIFTSHNLRAFETLSNNNIYCSTVNPKNRYIKLSGINANNNKRDFYIRSLVLGGQKETLYSGDDLDNIGFAFRQAGKQVEVENEN